MIIMLYGAKIISQNVIKILKTILKPHLSILNQEYQQLLYQGKVYITKLFYIVNIFFYIILKFLDDI